MGSQQQDFDTMRCLFLVLSDEEQAEGSSVPRLGRVLCGFRTASPKTLNPSPECRHLQLRAHGVPVVHQTHQDGFLGQEKKTPTAADDSLHAVSCFLQEAGVEQQVDSWQAYLDVLTVQSASGCQQPEFTGVPAAAAADSPPQPHHRLYSNSSSMPWMERRMMAAPTGP